ncbi:MAG: non-ribosomal peptide synthetase, partial [Actinobacteria bacterium]|nr:non-ribosomal peptide synthetase [Actinomycetota bacterium]
MDDIIQDISKLSPEKQKLLELLLKEQNVNLAESKIIPARRETNRFPLSYAQQRMWFLEQLEPGTPLYNNPAAVLLKGKLDIAAMQKTLDEMSLRHEVLRTTFVSEKGKPVQIIHPELKLTLEQLDLSDLPPEEREKELKEAANKAAQTPFDLGNGPLLRTILIRLEEQKHVLLLTMHHIISDA